MSLKIGRKMEKYVCLQSKCDLKEKKSVPDHQKKKSIPITISVANSFNKSCWTDFKKNKLKGEKEGI